MIEGYTGIGWSGELLLYDMFTLAFMLVLSVFAYAFYTCYPLFEKMIRGFALIQERQNLFDPHTKENFFFDMFMWFQTLFLCAVFSFLCFYQIADIQGQNAQQAFTLLAVFCGLLMLFYALKQCLYFIYGRVLAESNKYKLWRHTYRTLFHLWGMILYFPVLWLLIDRERYTGALILFFISFLMFRITAIYVNFRIFYHKNNGLLLLNLYLCGQEIIPLLFLYKSLTYLYNVIETSSNLWQ